MIIEIPSYSRDGFSRALAQFAPIDIVIRGRDSSPDGTPSEKEDREAALTALAKSQNCPIWDMCNSAPITIDDRRVKEGFTISIPGRDPATPLWHELTEWLSTRASGKHLLLDMTSLGGSCLFQLHRAAHEEGSIRLSYIYTSPQYYPQVERPDAIPPVITRAIKQPYGYRSFAQEHMLGQERKHVIVLGFDRHRPNKFIEHYQWSIQQVHVLLGNPAYVEGGVEQAKLSLGTVFDEIRRFDHVHDIDPKRIRSDGDGVGVVDVLHELGQDDCNLDIVPLGPKPTLLGCIVYWHELSEEKREKTRFLYDFPAMRAARTRGIGTTWLYPEVLVPSK